jgi:hypothetical protein
MAIMSSLSGITTTEQIVTNGLIVNLDALNNSSYSGSGTTWTDISGSGNNATLVSSPAYTASSPGYFTMNGSTTTINAINLSSYTNLTIEIWLYDSRTYSGEQDILTYNGNSGSYAYRSSDSSFRTDGDNLGARLFTGVSRPPQNTWYQLCYVKNANLYLNNTSYTGSGTDRTYGVLSIANTRTGINNRLNGRIGTVKIYNRSLTAGEVSQNFNALRGRYGI